MIHDLFEPLIQVPFSLIYHNQFRSLSFSFSFSFPSLPFPVPFLFPLSVSVSIFLSFFFFFKKKINLFRQRLLDLQKIWPYQWHHFRFWCSFQTMPSTKNKTLIWHNFQNLMIDLLLRCELFALLALFMFIVYCLSCIFCFLLFFFFFRFFFSLNKLNCFLIIVRILVDLFRKFSKWTLFIFFFFFFNAMMQWWRGSWIQLGPFQKRLMTLQDY